jgi:hypothetical protein
MNTERLTAFKEGMERPSYMEAPFEPILATVEDLENISEESSESLQKIFSSKNNNTMVKYEFHTREELSEGKVMQSSVPTDSGYVMSRVDTNNKFSLGYRNCVGLIVTGTTHDGERVSFLTHTNPGVFGQQHDYDEYIASLRGNLMELKNRCVIGSIDAVSFGGNAFFDDNSESFIDTEFNAADDYRIATEITASTVNDILEFTPHIAEGPRIKKGYDYESYEQKAFFNTQTRHLHILVTGGAANSGKSFEVSELDEEMNRLRVLQSKLPKRD